MELFHYTGRTSADKLDLNPAKYFGSNSYSKREKAVAGTPRTFFYTNPKQREVWFDNSKDLFSVTVDDNLIYDLISDPLQLKPLADRGMFLDLDKLFSLIVARGFIGAKFKNSQFDGVIVFTPITVTKVPEDRRKHLEGTAGSNSLAAALDVR